MTTTPAKTSSASRPTGVGESIKDYERVESTTALSISAAWIRTDVDVLSEDVRDLHERTRTLDLEERAYEKGTSNDVPALLEELAHDRGMGWADIAAAANVSVSAVRKWRKGGAATADNRQRLAQVAAFLDLLEEKDVADPVQWMEMTLPLPTGYRVRPVDLYAEGQADALLELVESRQEPAQLLDSTMPGWRAQRSEYEVFTDTDGQRSIRRRAE